MKKIIKVLLIAMLIGGSITTENQVQAQSVSVSFSLFQKSLSPYGRWMNRGNYGQVWVPKVRNFRPYETGGHWTYTDYGWTWVSDYNWGWAPFHYGRWNYETSIGWYWVPDYDWGPAWVAWRGGGDYYGWAPLSPGLNISVGVSFGNAIPYDRWVFAPHRYITSRYISRYYVPRTRNVTIIKNTTVVNNVTVKNNVHIDAGPRRDEVERINHTKIKTYTVANSSRPGKSVVNNNTINVYRPVVNKTTVVNNNKTVVNKNTNNTTVNKNKTTVNNDKTTVKNNTDNKTVNKNNDNNKTADTNKKTVNKAPQDNRVAKNKKVNSSNKQTTLKKSQPVKPKPAVNSANKNKPQEKKHDQKQKQNVPDSNKNGGKK